MLILRVPEKMIVPPKVLQRLKSELGEFQIDHFPAQPNYAQSISERIDSLHNAFQFVLKVYPLNPAFSIYTETLVNYANECKNKALAEVKMVLPDEASFERPETVGKYMKKIHEPLEQFVNELNKMLATCWPWKEHPSKIEQAIAVLNEAEQFLIMSKGRPNIATLTAIEEDYVVQVDKTLPAYDSVFLKELKVIKEAIKKKQSFEKAWEERSLPQWFVKLPQHQKYFISAILLDATDDADIKKQFSYFSSRHRTIPVPANFGSHSLLSVSKYGVLTEFYGDRYRSSHLVSRDMLDSASAEVQQRSCQSNLDTILKYAKAGQPVLIQTLISPLPVTKMVSGYVSVPPDAKLEETLSNLLSNTGEKTIIHTNHPLNYADMFMFTAKDDANCLKFLKIAKASEDYKPGSELETLVKSYEGVLNAAPHGLDWARCSRELALSSLEQLIILTMKGFSYGSCVSGKDRKAVELLFTDAFILYKKIYGRWPAIDDEQKDRQPFIEIVAKLYNSRHQQINAGFNAPGSNGIKTPNVYLPADIVKFLGAHWLACDDRLATDNEVKKIGDVSSNPKDLQSMHLTLTAKHLGEENCQKLYAALWDLLNEKELFYADTNVRASVKNGVKSALSLFTRVPNEGIPTGISKILKVSQDLSAGDNVDRMGKIFNIVAERPDSDGSRSTYTNLVYNDIRKLCDSPNQSTVDDVWQKWNKLFQQSKAKNHVIESSSSSPYASRSNPGTL